MRALNTQVAKGNLSEVVAIFGPDGKELIGSTDPAIARQNREVFVAAMSEGWRLVDDQNRKVLVVGREAWPFPVPLVKDGSQWRFDTAAGKEEIIARRIGRNELAAIRTCHTYVAAQRLYAARAHDGNPAGAYAVTFRSDPGRENGLYWPAVHGQPRSPLGVLMRDAAVDERGTSADGPAAPFHGYYFRILTGQGSSAPGGAKNYIVGSRMSGGFALIAWPAQYDATGVMTFIVNQDGIVHEKDLGLDTATAVAGTALYEPDSSWAVSE